MAALQGQTGVPLPWALRPRHRGTRGSQAASALRPARSQTRAWQSVPLWLCRAALPKKPQHLCSGGCWRWAGASGATRARAPPCSPGLGACPPLTIEELDAFDVVLVQLEVLDVAVHGVHQRLADARVVQAQGVPELVGCHQEDAVPWKASTTVSLAGALPSGVQPGPAGGGSRSARRAREGKGRRREALYLCLGTSPTCGPRHSCWWWRTRAARPPGPRWCRSCTSGPGR